MAESKAVERVGDALVVGEDGVHQLIDVAGHHLRFRAGHLHENLVLDLQVVEDESALRVIRGRQQPHQIDIQLHLHREEDKHRTAEHHQGV